MAKLTLDQKRLESLRRQLYGKQPSVSDKSEVKVVNQAKANPILAQTLEQLTAKNFQPSAVVEINYLKKDLLKILLLSLFAVATQVLLFFATRNNFLKLNF